MMEWIKRLPLLFIPLFILVYLLRDKTQTEMRQSSSFVTREVASSSKAISNKITKTQTRSEIKKLVIRPKIKIPF